MTRLGLGWMAVALISLTMPEPAHAAADQRSWQFEIAAPYLWLPEEHGHIGLGPVSVPVDVEFADVFDLSLGAGYKVLDFDYESREGSTRISSSTSADRFSASERGSSPGSASRTRRDRTR